MCHSSCINVVSISIAKGWEGRAYTTDTVGLGMIHTPGETESDNARGFQVTPRSTQFKAYEFLTSVTSHKWILTTTGCGEWKWNCQKGMTTVFSQTFFFSDSRDIFINFFQMFPGWDYKSELSSYECQVSCHCSSRALSPLGCSLSHV